MVVGVGSSCGSFRFFLRLGVFYVVRGGVRLDIGLVGFVVLGTVSICALVIMDMRSTLCFIMNILVMVCVTFDWYGVVGIISFRFR